MRTTVKVLREHPYAGKTRRIGDEYPISAASHLRLYVALRWVEAIDTPEPETPVAKPAPMRSYQSRPAVVENTTALSASAAASTRRTRRRRDQASE